MFLQIISKLFTSLFKALAAFWLLIAVLVLPTMMFAIPMILFYEYVNGMPVFNFAGREVFWMLFTVVVTGVLVIPWFYWDWNGASELIKKEFNLDISGKRNWIHTALIGYIIMFSYLHLNGWML